MSSTNPRLSIAALVGLALAGCGSTELQVKANEYPPVEAASFGTMHNVSVSGAIWVGATPQEADLELALRRGVSTILDLTSPEEASRESDGAVDAEAACRRLGLEYVHPEGIDGDETDDAAVDFVLATLSANAEQPILMYCGTGRRCAALLAIYRATELGVPLDEAIAEARRAGMRPEDAAFVGEQVERRQQAP